MGHSTVADRILAARVAADVTQAALAAKAGVSRVTIGRIERGANKPQFDTLERIASALGVTVDELLRPKKRRGGGSR